MERVVERFMEVTATAQEAFNRGDYETAFAGLAPDVEWESGDWVLDGGVMRGRDALVAFFQKGTDAGDWVVVAVAAELAAPGVILVHQRGTSTGRITRITGEVDFFQLYELGPEGVKRVREFRTREEALAAATKD